MRNLYASRWPLVLALAVISSTPAAESAAQPSNAPELLSLSGDLAVHDPVMIKEGEVYYLFCTGGSRRRGGIVPVRTSRDMRQWENAGFALERLPDWAADEVPRARNAWAPDISYFNGRFHLYYSLSSFGVNESAIGLATNKTLQPKSPDYQWHHEGLVVRSRRGQDDFNAIDPNLVLENESTAWLTWGSFWGGVMMRKIDPKTGKLAADDATLYKLAARPRVAEHQEPPTEGAIEAPFIVRHGDFWYLFVSWDFCCRGARSNYKVVVGRSAKVTGPFVDKDGKPMSDGGGTLILEAATDKWHGAGHPAVYREGDVDYLLVHAYAADTGQSRLQISTISWRDNWPVVAQLP